VRGVLVLVEADEHTSLRTLLRAFAGAGRPLHLVLDVAALSDVPVGDAAVMCVRPDDAAWLNRQRPRFAHRRLRVFLWASAATATELRERAPDFFDWISHHQAVPPTVPRFVRRALDLPLPGLRFEGTADEAAALLKACDVAAPPAAIAGQQHYARLVDAVRAHQHGWRILDGIDGTFWARHARWALAEADTRAPTILAGAAIHSPGWLAWSAKTLDPWAAAASLAAAGVPEPAAVAIACELEPAAVELACWLARANAWDAAARVALAADDVGAALASRADLPAKLRSEAPFVRAAATSPALRPAEATCKRALRSGHLVDPDVLAIVTSRARWTRPEPRDDATPLVRGWHIEALLRGYWQSARAYLTFARVAGLLGHADAQMTWAVRGCAAPRGDELTEELFAEFAAAIEAADDLDAFDAVLLALLADLRVRQEFGAGIGVYLRLSLAERRIRHRQFAEAERLLHDALAVAAGQPDLEADVCEELAELADLRGDAAAASAWNARTRALRPDADPSGPLSPEDRAEALLDRDDGPGAEAIARAGLAALTEHDPPARKTSLLDTLATALEQQDRLPEAAAAYDQLREHLRAHGGTRSHAAFSADAALAYLWIRLGRLDEAGALLQDRGRELVRLYGEDHLLGALFDIAAVELALARSDWVAAEAVARRLADSTLRLHGATSGDHLQAQALLGRALLRQGRIADALAPLRAVHTHAAALWSEDPELVVTALLDLDIALRQHGDAEQALAVLRELHARVRTLPPAQRDRHSISVVFSLGNLLSMLGRMREAADVYLKAIADDPHLRRAYLSTGSFAFMYSDRGPTWEAMILDELTRTLPDDREWRLHAFDQLARLYQHQRRWPEAEAILRASLTLQTPADPMYAHTMHDLYWHLRQLGRVPEAIAVLRELLAHPLPRSMHLGDPTFLRGELADLLLLTRDYTAAEFAAADPQLVGPRMHALYKQGKDAELELCAHAVLDETIHSRPGDTVHARLYLALLELRRGDVDAVLSNLRELAAGEPDAPAVAAAKVIVVAITVSRGFFSPTKIADLIRSTLEYQITPPRG